MFSFKCTKPSVLDCDGPDATAAIAMPLPAGYRQVVKNGDLPGIWVFDLNEELVAADTAVQLHPFEGFIQRCDGMKRVFQTIGQNGAKLSI